MRDWQPISTAPMDGLVLVLVYEPQSRFNPNRRDWVTVARYHPIQGWLDSVAGVWMNPTHWQPLPDPPSVGETPETAGPHENTNK